MPLRSSFENAVCQVVSEEMEAALPLSVGNHVASIPDCRKKEVLSMLHHMPTNLTCTTMLIGHAAYCLESPLKYSCRSW